jgi:hypothetical protein
MMVADELPNNLGLSRVFKSLQFCELLFEPLVLFASGSTFLLESIMKNFAFP